MPFMWKIMGNYRGSECSNESGKDGFKVPIYGPYFGYEEAEKAIKKYNALYDEFFFVSIWIGRKY